MVYSKYPLDANGNPFKYPTFILDTGEYAKIYNEINTNYSKFEGKEKCVHLSYYGEKAYMYYFENHGFDNYNIYMRKCIDE